MITRTAAELARLCGATLEGNGELELVGVASLTDAAPDQVSFVRDPSRAAELARTRAGAVVVPSDLRPERDDLALLRAENPNQAFSQVIASFLPETDQPGAGIHPSAVVEPEVRLGEGVSIGAHAYVGAGARIGDGAVLHPGVVLGARVEVGAGTVLYPRVVVYPGCHIGARCILHAGAVIGSDGFGFDPTPQGWEKVPQCGTVLIGDDVEVGANTAVDRGRFGPTRIGDGVKIDNLVQVAHNVVLERGVLVAAQAGIAGSTVVRRGAILGGQVGVAGHIEIGPGARVGAQGGVTGSIEGGKDYWGTPAREKARVLRIEAHVSRLPEVRRRLDGLERRLKELEEKAP